MQSSHKSDIMAMKKITERTPIGTIESQRSNGKILRSSSSTNYDCNFIEVIFDTVPPQSLPKHITPDAISI